MTKTIYFFASKLREWRASHRLRGQLISEQLNLQGIKSVHGNNLDGLNENDIIVFLKTSTVEQIENAKEKHAVTVYDICDNKFEENPDLEECALHADFITCNSKMMQEEIFYRIKKPSVVIPDPTERYKLPVHFAPRPNVRLLWFGSGSSLGYVNWPEVWQKLENKIGNYELTIVTSEADKFKQKTLFRLDKNEKRLLQANLDKIKFEEWSWANQQKHLISTDIIFIPFDTQHHRTKTKSPTRVIDSLISGKFVITSEIASYREFKDFIWIKDYIKGISWALENPNEVNRMIDSGQKYVIENYSVAKITDKWLDFFNYIKHD